VLAVLLSIAYSTAVLGWVVHDARRRGRRWIRWGTLTWFFGLFAVAAWLVARRGSKVRDERPSAESIAAIYTAALCLVLLSLSTRVAFVTYVYQVARVEGQAMAPTLRDQDRLVVDKWRYRTEQPQVGDIVMLLYPPNPDRSFVKRVVGEAGDALRSVNGTVFRNDHPLDDSFVPADYRSHDNWGPIVVPEGHYFVMGDHRNNSSDSRSWGFVPASYMLGRVRARWWPFSAARTF
jgi:signal peptidase I